MVKFNLLFNFHLQFTNKSVGSLCFKYENNKIDHPHGPRCHGLYHGSPHGPPDGLPYILSLPGKEQQNDKEPGTTRNNKEIHI